MKEYIEREAVCNDCNNLKICVDKSLCPVGRAPAADVVEVVRCKDCEYYENEECVNPYIWMSDGAHLWPDEDFYCAKGERRSDP